MKRKFTIAMSIVILIVLTLAVFLILTGKKSDVGQEAVVPQAELQPPVSFNDLITNGVTIDTPTGESFEFKDLYKNAEEIITPSDVVLERASEYEILFYNYPNEKSFLISILSSEVGKTRKIAEEELLKTLSITKEEACKLKVSVTVPASYSQEYSGQELGLSFCPGAKVLK